MLTQYDDRVGKRMGKYTPVTIYLSTYTNSVIAYSATTQQLVDNLTLSVTHTSTMYTIKFDSHFIAKFQNRQVRKNIDIIFIAAFGFQ